VFGHSWPFISTDANFNADDDGNDAIFMNVEAFTVNGGGNDKLAAAGSANTGQWGARTGGTIGPRRFRDVVVRSSLRRSSSRRPHA
jgi:hypothetical protein